MRYLLLISLILWGCEDKTYTHIYDKKAIGTTLPALSLSESNQTIRMMLKDALQKEGFILKRGSPYSIEIDQNSYHHKCNNPTTATYDATYDGFVKLTLLKRMQPLYMCQKDYHGKLNSKVFQTLLQKMQEELKVHP